MRRVVLVGFAMGCAAISGAQTFVNGGFESGDFTGWTIGFTDNGATAVQNVESHDIDGPGSLGPSLAGRFSVGRASTTGATEGGINLTQSLNLVAGTTYEFSYNWSATRPAGLGSNTQGGIFRLIVNGTSIAQQLAGSTSGTAPKYGLLTVSYLATATGAHSVGAQIVRPFTIPTPTAPTLFQHVDNFSVVVPEPATMAVLGMGALALLRRRRK